MEPKLDGWRWQISVEEASDGTVIRHVGGRNGREQSGKTPLIDRAFEDVPAGTVLDGELIVRSRGGHSGSVGSALSNGGRGLQFVAFDLLMFDGHDTTGYTYADRRRFLEAMEEMITTEHVWVLPQMPVSQATLDEWIAAGGEGAVCKSPRSTYRPGKRTREWLKLKAEFTVDARVTGFKKGQGKSNGHKNAALVFEMLDGGTESSCGLGSHADDATANPERWLGRIIELKCNGVFESGAPRHPIFVRFRDDLEPAQNGDGVPSGQVPPEPETDTNGIDVEAGGSKSRGMESTEQTRPAADVTFTRVPDDKIASTTADKVWLVLRDGESRGTLEFTKKVEQKWQFIDPDGDSCPVGATKFEAIALVRELLAPKLAA
jgi:bifunctional non-homologous end joining protein LigD